ncbi:MAG: HNH endonuclease [Prevotella sp.]|nr:HNH endonuclease [Prevotella sp.]
MLFANKHHYAILSAMGIALICVGNRDYMRWQSRLTPWSEGGKTAVDNCQMLCRDCNRRKSNK